MEQLKGVKSFLQEAMTRQGAEYNDEIGNEVVKSYNYDFDRLISDVGRADNIPEENLDNFKNDIYKSYGFTPMADENLAEIHLISDNYKFPDDVTGYDRYSKLNEAKSINQGLIENLQRQLPQKGKQEDILNPDFTQPSSSTQVQQKLDPGLSDQPEDENAIRDYNIQTRIADLSANRKNIDDLIAEQANINKAEFGYVSQQAEEIDKDRQKNLKLLDEAIEIRNRNATTQNISGVGMGVPVTTYLPEDRQRVKDLKDIKSLYDKTMKVLGSPQGGSVGEELKGLMYGFGKNFFTQDFASLGLTEMTRNLNVKSAFDNYQEAIKEYGEEQAMSMLPKEEQSLLQTYQLFKEIQGGSEANFASTIGEGLKDMIPFIVQFAATGGTASSAKKIVKEFIESKTKSALLGKVSGTGAKIVSQAAMMVPMNLQTYSERVMPQMQDGELVAGEDPTTALWKTGLYALAEVAGEEFTDLSQAFTRSKVVKMLANNPTKSQQFLGKLGLYLTQETGVPTVQNFVFEGLGEEFTGITEAAIDEDGSFFTTEAQSQLWALTLAASGSSALLSVPKRYKVKSDFAKAQEYLADIPNENYTEAVTNLVDNYPDQEEIFKAFDEVSNEIGVSEEDYLKARYFLAKSIEYNSMSSSRAYQISQDVAQFKDDNGNVTTAVIEGKPYYVRNTNDLNKEDKIIYVKDRDGNVKPVSSNKITQWKTLTEEEIQQQAAQAQDQTDQAYAEEEAVLQEAEEKGIVEEKTMETPSGKGRVVSVNPDRTVTLVNDKGEQFNANLDEVEPYLTSEQKKEKDKAEKTEEERLEYLKEGIDPGAEIVSDEEQELPDGKTIQVVDFDNGQSKIITNEEEQIFASVEERDAALLRMVEPAIKDAPKLSELPKDQAFELMREQDEELAIELLSEDIADLRSQAKKLRSSKQGTVDERFKNKIEAKKLEAEADRLESVMSTPKNQKLADQAESLFMEYQQEQEDTEFNRLEPWQQDLLGMKVDITSLNNQGDPNFMTPKIRRNWISPKKEAGSASNKVDVIAEELSQKAGRQLSAQDIVDFIYAHPNRSARTTTDRMNEIRSEYKTLTGKSINNHKEFISELGVTPTGIVNTEDQRADDYDQAIAKLKELGYSDEQINAALNEEPVSEMKPEDNPLGEAPADVPFKTTATEEIQEAEQETPGVVKESEYLDITEKAMEDLKNRQNAHKALIQISDELGQVAHIINSSEMPKDVRRSERKRLASDRQAAAFVHNGEMYIISDRINRVSEAKKDYIHELLVHKKLKEAFNAGPQTILGKQYAKFEELLNDVYTSMSDKDKLELAKVYFPHTYSEYFDEKGKLIKPISGAMKSEIAEEFLAHMSEQEAIPTKWQEFLDRLIHLIRKAFGFTSGQFTRSDLQNILNDTRRKIYDQKNKTEVPSTLGKEEVKFRTQDKVEPDYKKWKKQNVTVRGVEGNPYDNTEEGNNKGAAMLGLGLYTAPLSNKKMAEEYGDVYFVTGARPENPKKFDSVNEWEIWMQNYMFKTLGLRRKSDFSDKGLTIEGELQKLGYDGIEIKGREIVNFNPNDIRYFKTEEELKQYHNILTSDIRFRVAKSQDEIADFIKDSKVKETVYHGTNAQFEDFENLKRSTTGMQLDGFYFSPKQSVAEAYAHNAAMNSGEFSGETENIKSAKINLKNPRIYNNLEDFISADRFSLEAEGYDGAIRNDDIGNNIEIVVFSNDQVLIEPKDDPKFKVQEARQEVETNPTEAQKEAGNYKMGHVRIDGFDITIENPKGSTRSGVNDDGEKWENVLPADYGYIKGTTGKDKDHLDVLLGDNLESDKVYVVDQVNKDGSFDEHKIMMGYNSIADAKKAYRGAYQKGWNGLGDITRTTKEGLREWFKGDTTVPFAGRDDIRFRIQSTDPKLQKMLDEMYKIQMKSKVAQKIEELGETAKTTLPKDRQSILDKIEGIKEGARLGKSDVKEQIKTVQTVLTNYAKKYIPLGEAGSRDIGSILTLIKDSQTPESLEKAFERIDELTGNVTEKSQKSKHERSIKRVMKWATGLKKKGDRKVGKFNIEETRQFKELKEVNNQAINLSGVVNSNNSTQAEKDTANEQLEAKWQEINSKEDKTMLDDLMMKIIEWRRNGAKSSLALVKSIDEDLQTLYNKAKDIKSESDLEAALERSEDREFIKGFVRDVKFKDKSLVSKTATSINNFTGNVMGNWETILTMLGGIKARDKFSLILEQVDQEMGIQNSFNTVLDKAMKGYGLKSRNKMLQRIQDLKKKDYTLVKPLRNGKRGEGNDLELSKMDILDIYNAIKNPEIRGDYYLAYGDVFQSVDEEGKTKYDRDAQKAVGKKRIDALLSELNDGDRNFADSMQEQLDSYYDRMNEVFVKVFNRDLPKVDFYWPSTAEFKSEADVFNQTMQDAKHPSATQERTAHRSPKVGDAFDKFAKHVKHAEWYVNMALPLERLNKIFSDINTRDLIQDARGEGFYKTITAQLKDQGLQPATRDLTDFERIGGNILGNWVAAKIGMTPSVPIKQLTSVINYAENMPAEQWLAGFVKGLANPKDTFKEMWDNIPYLQDRFKGGYSEALQYAMNATTGIPKTRTWLQAIKNIETMGTRSGDIAAIIYGGKPYIDYLIKQGMPKKEAYDKFLLDTLRSQQAPFSSTLSLYQNSKNPMAKALFTFANTPSQYMRKMFEANQAYRHGDITFRQLTKIYAIYGIANQFLYVAAGAVVASMMRGTDPDDDLWTTSIAQAITSLVGGVPLLRDVVTSISREALGLKVYDPSLPVVSEMIKAGIDAVKVAKGDEKSGKYAWNVTKTMLELAGLSAQNIEKLFNAKNIKTETRMKETSSKLNEISKPITQYNKDISSLSKMAQNSRKKLPDYQQAENAKDLRYAYTRAKSKAKKFEESGNSAKAEQLNDLIKKSKVNLSFTDFKPQDIKTELDQFTKMYDMIIR